MPALRATGRRAAAVAPPPPMRSPVGGAA